MKLFIKIFIFLLLLGGGYYAYEHYYKKNEKIIYKTISPTKGDIAHSIESVGEVYATSIVNVGAQVSGQIKKLYVKVGDEVKKGDKIADIDDEKQKDELKRQEAQLNIYKSRLKSKRISVGIIKKEYEREKALYKKRATSLESLEKAKNNYIQNRAGIEEIEANIAQANIALNTAKTNLAYTKIIAPMDGTIISIPTKEGQTVNANQSTPNIAIVANLTQMEVRMQIAEGDITKVKVGQKIRFSILSDEKEFNATLNSIDPAYTRASDNLSRTANSAAVYYYAKFIVPNEEGLLRIGMTTQNSIIIKESKEVLLLPVSATYNKEGKTFVYILKNEEPVKQNIEVGVSDGINIEIKSGITLEDKVITTPIVKEDKKAKKMRVRVR